MTPLQTFRRFEPHLTLVLEHWPNVTEFNPTDITIAYLATGLRAAIDAHANTCFTPTTVPPFFPSVANTIFVSAGARPGSLIVGPKSVVLTMLAEKHAKTRTIVAASPLALDGPISGVIDNPDATTLSAIAVLHAKRLLCTPTRVRTNLNLAEVIPATLDVAYTCDNGVWTIV